MGDTCASCMGELLETPSHRPCPELESNNEGHLSLPPTSVYWLKAHFLIDYIRILFFFLWGSHIWQCSAIPPRGVILEDPQESLLEVFRGPSGMQEMNLG